LAVGEEQHGGVAEEYAKAAGGYPGVSARRSKNAAYSNVWRQKEPSSVVQHLILASFTGIFGLPKKAKFVRKCCAGYIECPF
jgi:hypothetical protein